MKTGHFVLYWYNYLTKWLLLVVCQFKSLYGVFILCFEIPPTAKMADIFSKGDNSKKSEDGCGAIVFVLHLYDHYSESAELFS